MKENINKKLIIDFDSTFVSSEGLPELALIALKNNPNKKAIAKEIEDITNLGMNGEISFTESLRRRIKLLQANKKHVEELGEYLKDKVSLTVEKNINFFKENAENIFILSGGFFEFVFPTVRLFNVPANHVYANTFLYNENNEVIGFDEKNYLSEAMGKVKVLKSINMTGEIIAVGDGYTDYETREAGLANKFIAFTENVTRAKVVEKADCVAKSFDEVIEIYREN